MACLYNENRVVIHDQETGEQKKIEVKEPWKCAASQHMLAVTTNEDGLHLYSTKGDLVLIVPDSSGAHCVAFHLRNTNFLAIGYNDGTVRVWDISTQAYVSLFKDHTNYIMNIRFAPDGRLFLSSWDNTASIVTLDHQLQIVSSIKLQGHTNWVNDIIPLFLSNQCVTCSSDRTIKVWDYETGACLRTLTEHTHYVVSLAMHPSGQYFASGSYDRSVIIWSCETFHFLRRFPFPSFVQSVILGECNALYVGVHGHGVMSCNTHTGDVGPVIVAGTGFVRSLSLSKLPLLTRQYTTHSHS